MWLVGKKQVSLSWNLFLSLKEISALISKEWLQCSPDQTLTSPKTKPEGLVVASDTQSALPALQSNHWIAEKRLPRLQRHTWTSLSLRSHSHRSVKMNQPPDSAQCDQHTEWSRQLKPCGFTPSGSTYDSFWLNANHCGYTVSLYCNLQQSVQDC